MPEETLLYVGMTCGGCSGAVKRILNKLSGVEDVDADVDTKKVVVSHDKSIDEDDILRALEAWSKSAGKEVRLWSEHK